MLKTSQNKKIFFQAPLFFLTCSADWESPCPPGCMLSFCDFSTALLWMVRMHWFHVNKNCSWANGKEKNWGLSQQDQVAEDASSSVLHSLMGLDTAGGCWTGVGGWAGQPGNSSIAPGPFKSFWVMQLIDKDWQQKGVTVSFLLRARYTTSSAELLVEGRWESIS